MSHLVLESLTKVHRGGVVAVDALDVVVPDGSYVVIVGPSGGGKTTTLRLVAGLDRPTRGVVRVDGVDVTRTPPERRGMAMARQDAALYPHLSVRGNLAFALRQQGMARAEIDARIASIAEQLEIGALLGRRATALSGGERQRVSLGRVLVRRPRCALLDEPLSDLDAPLRFELRTLLRTAQRATGTTTLHVTHDQEEATALADRLVVMAGGRKQQEGTATAVHDRPANRFVAGFVGWPPMNFVEGRLAAGEAGLVLDAGHGLRIPLPASRGGEASAGAAGSRVVLGVRPAQLQPSRPEAADGPSLALPAVVRRAAPTGAATDVEIELPGGVRWLMRRPSSAPEVDPGPLTLHARLAHVHLFAAEGGGERRPGAGG